MGDIHHLPPEVQLEAYSREAGQQTLRHETEVKEQTERHAFQWKAYMWMCLVICTTVVIVAAVIADALH